MDRISETKFKEAPSIAVCLLSFMLIETSVAFTPGYNCSRLMEPESRALCLQGGGSGGDGVNYGGVQTKSEASSNPLAQSVLPTCPSRGWRDMCFGEAHGPGYSYRGEFKNHRFHGRGVIEYAHGESYAGNFKDDNYDGFGIYYGTNKQVLEQGLWRMGSLSVATKGPANPTEFLAQTPTPAATGGASLAQGNLIACRGSDVSRWTNCFGTNSYPNGDKYVGEFKGGKRHQGTYTFANGNEYVGEWRDSKQNGQGTLTFANGDKYFGEFKDGKRNGQGTYTLANGNQYVGEWRDGKNNGQGIFTFADGRPPREGIWEDNKLVRAQRIPDHIAGRTSNQPVAQAPRSVEAPRSTSPLTLSASATQPSPDGVVTLSITTNNATASLKINGDEEGGRTDGRYSVRKFAQVGDNRFEVVAVDGSGNTQRQTVTVSRALEEVVARSQPLNPT